MKPKNVPTPTPKEVPALTPKEADSCMRHCNPKMLQHPREVNILEQKKNRSAPYQARKLPTATRPVARFSLSSV